VIDPAIIEDEWALDDILDSRLYGKDKIWIGTTQMEGNSTIVRVDDSHALSNQAKEDLKSPNLTDLKTSVLISFLGLLPRQRGRCLFGGRG
jgi:hypothetical protein